MNVGDLNIKALSSQSSGNSSRGSGEALKLCSPSLYSLADSRQVSLGVYVQYSTIDDGEPSEVEAPVHSLHSYHRYSSACSRFRHAGYDVVGKLRFSYRKFWKTVHVAKRKLSNPNLSQTEIQSISSELAKTLAYAKGSLKLLTKRIPLYGDYYAIYVPEDYSKFIKFLGFSPDDVHAGIWITKARAHLEFDDGLSESLDINYISRVSASRYHPLKGIFKGSQEAKRILHDLFILSDLLEGNLYSNRSQSETVHNLLPLRPVVLTAPKDISQLIWNLQKIGDDSAFKSFKKAGAKAIRRFIKYLAESEKVPTSDLVDGFILNVHVVGDSNPFVPHYHIHALLVLAVYDKSESKWYRLKPLFGEPEIEKLREFWTEELSKAFGSLVPSHKKLDVWAGDRYYSLPVDVASVFFEIKYNARKLFVSYAQYYAVHSFNPDDVENLDFVHFVFKYKNRTERYGFMKNVKRYLVSLGEKLVSSRLSEVVELLEFAESELALNGDNMSEKLRNEIEERVRVLKEEKERLETEGFEYLYQQAEQKAEKLLSRENITHERIIGLLDTLYSSQGRRIVGYEFEVIEDDVPLWEFLDELASTDGPPPPLVLIGDKHRFVEFVCLDNLNF